MTEKIEYEQVTIKVPKLVMDFLRKTEDDPIKAIEHMIVDCVRVDLEAMTGVDLIAHFQLGPVFKAILDDDRFIQKEA